MSVSHVPSSQHYGVEIQEELIGQVRTLNRQIILRSYEEVMYTLFRRCRKIAKSDC
jgi:hypothetical protein